MAQNQKESTKAGDIIARYEKMKTQRNIYHSLWDDLTEFVLPSKGTYTYRTTPNSVNDPERKSRRRLDSTPVNAARTLMARVVAEMTGTTSRWFDFRHNDPELDKVESVRRCLQQLSDKAYKTLGSGTFKTAHVEATMDWIVYGTGCMMIEEQSDSTIAFRAICPQELFISENKFGEIDVVYRCFKFTYRQAMEFFGEDQLPDYLTEKCAKDPTHEIEFLHCVEPNDSYNPAKKKNSFYKYTSTYIMLDGKEIVKEGYFKKKPYIVFRFWKRPSEVWGGSPAVDAMADIRQLNVMSYAHGNNIQLRGSPPLIMAHDSVIMPLKIVPNGINYGGVSADGKRQIFPLIENPGDLSALENYMEQKRQAIRSAFFVDPLINRENSIRTAAEVNKRAGEEIIGIIPFITRYEIEYLTFVLDFVLDHVLRHDKTIVIPQELNGQVPEIEFSGPLAKTQRSQELNNIVQFLQLVQPMAQIDPTILQNLNANATFMELVDLLGIPMGVVQPAEVVAAMQAQAQAQQQQQVQMQQQQMAMQNVGGAVDKVSDLAKAGVFNGEAFAPPV